MPVNDDQDDVSVSDSDSDAEWLDSYPDIAQDEGGRHILSQYKSEEAAFQGLIDATKKISTGFRLPARLSETEQAEVLAAVAKAKAVPEKAEKYEISDPPDVALPPNMAIHEEVVAAIKQLGIKENISPQGVQAIYDLAKAAFRKQDQVRAREIEERRGKVEQKLVEIWGGQQRADTLLEYVKRHLRRYAESQDDWEQFQYRMFKSGLGDEPILLRALAPWAEAQEAEGSSPASQAAAAKVNDFQARLKKAKGDFPNSPALWPKS